jgi:hypothetical protein
VGVDHLAILIHVRRQFSRLLLLGGLLAGAEGVRLAWHRDAATVHRYDSQQNRSMAMWYSD